MTRVTLSDVPRTLCSPGSSDTMGTDLWGKTNLGKTLKNLWKLVIKIVSDSGCVVLHELTAAGS